jgi:Lipase (class 3)
MNLLNQLTSGTSTPLGFNPLNSTSSAGLARGLLDAVPGREVMNWPGIASNVSTLAQAGSNAPSPGTGSVDRKSLALMASDVYNAKSSPPPGFREATANDLKALKLEPIDLKSGKSAFTARVYVSGSGADTKYVVAFRGSTSDKGDWIANGKQALGNSTDHYDKAQTIGRQLARSGNTNVTITGHSLGGGLASATAIASGKNAVTFNAAGLSDATIRTATQIRTTAGVANAGKVDAYFVKGEALSKLQDGGDRIVGAIVGTLLGGPLGGISGATKADAPEAYGKRIALDPVRPNGIKDDGAVARHGMDWVISSLPK